MEYGSVKIFQVGRTQGRLEMRKLRHSSRKDKDDDEKMNLCVTRVTRVFVCVHSVVLSRGHGVEVYCISSIISIRIIVFS